MIRFQQVSFGYENTNTLKEVSFHITKGDFVAILGANGAGKTTLSKMMNGILKPISGDVFIMDENTRKTKTSKLAKHVGFLFQNPDRQICKNTVREEILFGLECVKSDKEYCKMQCEKILQEFHLPADENPFRLSRGQRQLVALASTIAIEPDILVLDEPTTGLDYRECMHIMNYITELNKKGVTIIMITHDMELTLDFAKQVMVMNQGTLLKYGPMREVMKDKELLARAKLIPPQIANLALQLEGFDGVYTNQEMLTHIMEVSHERIS